MDAGETHMTTTKRKLDRHVKVCTLAELEREGRKVISADGRTILVLLDGGKVYALDNRCPHMGFPLHRGTVQDGILTCHWHHARFDLKGGCTLDPFADDAPAFHAEVRDGVVWVDPRPVKKHEPSHWMAKLEEGLEQNIRLVLAKSVVELEKLGATKDILKIAALFGVRNRSRGWSSGLSILTAMANVLPELDEPDRPLALYHGLVCVARSTAGQPPDFDLQPLDTTENRPERYISWFRRFIDTRSANAGERVLRTAIRIGLPEKAVADMIFAACTDHLYLDEGHSLDSANKAFELLDHVGWENAEAILPSLIPNLVEAHRMEETSSWRHPVDLPSLLYDLYAELNEIIAAGGGKLRDWEGHQELAETILDGEAPAILDSMKQVVRQGVPLTELSAAVAYAAARRAVHFPVSNEFDDWNTVHHTFTYANAVDQAMRRAPSNLLARGIFDGAMSVYLERFLNVPKQAIPRSKGRDATGEELLREFDSQGRVNETAALVTELLTQRQHGKVLGTLGHALLREDSGFHQFQMYEAGLRQHRQFAGRPLGDDVLIGVARFLTAHSPTVRMIGQTFDIAARLQRGETLHDIPTAGLG